MKKQVIRITESELKQIIHEATNHILNEIGDTRRGQYLLGKFYKKKRDEELYKDGERNWDNAWNATKHIRDYASKNNQKSGAGDDAFRAGENATFNKDVRDSELAKKGKTKRRSEQEIFQALADQDSKENVMNPEDIREYAFEWLKSHKSSVLRYRGDKYAQNTLHQNGCKNLGEYILHCYNEDKVPGYFFYAIFCKKIYDELNLYHDGSVLVSGKYGFREAWEDFCDYIYDGYETY